MRLRLAKAIKKATGKWVETTYFDNVLTDVHKETICEAIDGLTSNGRQLYEHDTVTIKTSNYIFFGYELVWNDEDLCWCGKRRGKPENDGFDTIKLNSKWAYIYEGNAFDDWVEKKEQELYI